ncbi:MAG: type II secretion system F family protein [Cryomorphaceae bacterium]
MQVNLEQVRINQPRSERAGPGVSSSILELLNRDISISNSGFSHSQKASVYRDLQLMLDTGIEIRMAVQLLADEEIKKNPRKVLDELSQNLMNGLSLSKAMEISGHFSSYEYQNVLIGEETGTLGRIISHLAEHFTASVAQKKKIVSALSYPVLVLLASLGAVGFMLQFVVPMFEDVFTRFGGELPWSTRIVVSISDWLGSNGLVIFLGVAAVFFLCRIFRKHETFRRGSSWIFLNLPLLNGIIRASQLSRFSSAMHLLLASHHPLVKSLALVRSMVAYYPIEQSLQNAEELIISGKSLSYVFAQSKFYPHKMIALIRMAEEVNQLDTVFARLHEQYSNEVKYKSELLSNVLEPVMIIGIGVSVGIILVAMYLPLFQLSSGIQ